MGIRSPGGPCTNAFAYSNIRLMTDGDISINRRVKQVREALKLSQAQCSRIISLSNGYLGGIETGKRAVNERLVKLICAAFNVNNKWLKTGEGEMFNQHTGDFSKVLSFYRQLDPEYQEYILKQIELLLAIQNKHPRL
jgi:transcriptional regulator with XRE-family HTH domain